MLALALVTLGCAGAGAPAAPTIAPESAATPAPTETPFPPLDLHQPTVTSTPTPDGEAAPEPEATPVGARAPRSRTGRVEPRQRPTRPAGGHEEPTAAAVPSPEVATLPPARAAHLALVATDQRRERTRLVVQGTGFLPGEPVRLTLTTARAHYSRNLVANPQGLFQVEMSAAWRRCTEPPPTLSATGSLGSTGTLAIAASAC